MEPTRRIGQLREVADLLRDPGPAWRDLRLWFREARRPVERRNRLDDEGIRRLLGFALAPDANCVDVGAHQGSVLADVVRVAPDGDHVAFEPVPELAAALRVRFPKVVVHEAAVAAEPGTSSFTVVRDAPALSGLRARGGVEGLGATQTTVAVATLDDALPAGYVPRLIKIDVEGGELGVLRGGIRTLTDHRPIVVFEHGLEGASHYDTAPDDVYDLLVSDVGLRIFDLDGGGPYSRHDFAALAFSPSGGRWNWVAHR